MEEKKIIIDGHEAVDLGLSVKWATCNIGATTPKNYGDYFAWGEIEPKEEYITRNYPHIYYDEKNYINFKDIGKDISNSQYDTAHVKWGEKWRMPTCDELYDLIDECKWEWIRNNDCVGYKVVGPNGNSIFLPAAGCYENSSKNYRFDIGGYYWSSSELFWHELTGTFLLEFNEEYVDGDNTYRRHCGYSIRPVTDK